MLALLLVFSTALAHGPDGCPSTFAALQMVQKGPLDAKTRSCVDAPSERPGELAAKAWTRWRDELWAGRVDGPATEALLAQEPNPERVIEAAEALLAGAHPQAGLAIERARQLLEAAPFSVGRQRLAVRWAEVARASGAQADVLPEPAAPEAASLTQCSDLGRLWARAAVGGIYGTDRDCVVRLTQTLDGDARVTAGYLALAMAWRHRDHEEAVLVGIRVAELLPQEAGVAQSLAALYADVGDAAGHERWNARASELSR